MLASFNPYNSLSQNLLLCVLEHHVPLIFPTAGTEPQFKSYLSKEAASFSPDKHPLTLQNSQSP